MPGPTSSSSSASPAPAGQLLADRYRLDRRIGTGGMAEVWVATDTGLDRKVAVKWLKTNLAGDEVVAERFRREAIAVARLSHPNIVAVHDVVEHEGRQAVVMQLIDGKSLRQLLDSQRRLGPELTIHIGAAIAGALDAAHQGGFVHRDVKPGNILVTSDGRVLLTDFGIAKGLSGGDDDLTSDNVMMGTAKYLSPEQVRGRRLDGRADLYSLGLVLYECLAGRVPFLGESDADTALARLQRDPTDLGHLRPTLPIGLVNLIHTTLARNPAHRPQSGAELRAALLSVDTSPPEIDRTPAEPPPRIANPPTRALGAGPGIPGDPHISGSVAAVRRSASTPGDATPPAGRAVTPAAGIPIRGAPARRDQQRWTPSLVLVGTLIVAALVVALILFIGLNRGETDEVPAGSAPSTPADQGEAAAPPDTDTADTAESGDVRIAGIAAWDPDGDNQRENDEQAELALAGGTSGSAWASECYQDRFLGGKRGVGLVLTLSAPAAGTFTVDSLNSPYQIELLVTDADRPPADPDAWTPAGETRFADQPGTVSFEVTEPVTHAALWVTELGTDTACSTANPYRARLGEVAFSP